MASSNADAKDIAFREYLVKSRAAEELIKVLVGLEESSMKPEEPIKYLKEMFASQELQDVASKRFEPENIEVLQSENAQLKQRIEALETDLEPKLAQIKLIERDEHVPQLQRLIEIFMADGTDEVFLDVGKLYMALAAAPLCDEDTQDIAPWAAEGAELPSGLVSSEGLEVWAERCFTFSCDFALRYPGISLEVLCTYCIPPAEAEEAPTVAPLALALAQGLHESCVALGAIASEEAQRADPSTDEC